MSEYLLYDGIKFDKKFKLEFLLKTPDDSDIGYIVEFYSKHPD